MYVGDVTEHTAVLQWKGAKATVDDYKVKLLACPMMGSAITASTTLRYCVLESASTQLQRVAAK